MMTTQNAARKFPEGKWGKLGEFTNTEMEMARRRGKLAG
jgi:hypothetical protein